MGAVIASDIRPGMTLAADVHAFTGRILLPRGARLMEEHIRLINSWGVDEVDVIDRTPSNSTSQPYPLFSREHLGKAEAHVATLFRDIPPTPFMDFIRSLSIQHTTHTLSMQGSISGCHCMKITAPPLSFNKPDSLDSFLAAASVLALDQTSSDIIQVLTASSRTAQDVHKACTPELEDMLLLFINSSLYAFPSHIVSIGDAADILGGYELSLLALSLSLSRMLYRAVTPSFDTSSFWKHSLGCALFSQLISRDQGGFTEERFFLSGILHDIGRLVLFTLYPEAMRQAVSAAHASNISLTQAEQELFGFDHSQAGADFLLQLGISHRTTRPIKFHHCPENNDELRSAAIIQVSDLLARLTLPGAGTMLPLFTLPSGSWNSLNIPQERLATMIAKVNELLPQLGPLLFTNPENRLFFPEACR